MADASPSVILMPDTLYRLDASTTALSARGSLRCPTKVVEMNVSSIKAKLCSIMGNASFNNLNRQQ
jgi:hypothetical protein